ncbi:MAG: hypothetical protein A2W17_07880 [Planctomycetes bacterium RBG_16_41_13]|nr:MAG: hypothetical protein A2W17_07880 [Planctomycetes bacterium RBG_16_41_13]
MTKAYGFDLLSLCKYFCTIKKIVYRSKATTKKSLTTKGTKNSKRKGHKEKLTKKRGFYRVIL